MFGAYQAGAWKALARNFRPDLVVGASAGALNAWAIAGGCSPEELCAIWTTRETADLMRRRRGPMVPWRGVFDSDLVHSKVNDLYARFRPVIPYGTSIVQLPRFRQVWVRGEDMTAAHLRASCAIPFGFPPERIDGKYYVDGGLLSPVPLWAAMQMGATSAVAINVLEFMPSVVLRAGVGAFRAAMAPKVDFSRIAVTWIRPSVPLGTVRDALFWKEENARRWIELGGRDAAAVSGRLAEEGHPERLARG